MKRVKIIAIFVAVSLVLVAVTQIPLIALYLDEQRLLKQVNVEKIDLQNQSFQKSKLNNAEKIELLYGYYHESSLENVILVSQQQKESSYDSAKIKEKIKEQVVKLQSLNVFPKLDLDDYTIHEFITTTYSKANNPEHYVSFLDIALRKGDSRIQFLIDQDNNLVYQYGCTGSEIKNVPTEKILETFGTKYLGISKKTAEKFYFYRSTDNIMMLRIY